MTTEEILRTPFYPKLSILENRKKPEIMTNKFRKSPLVCLFIALIRMYIGRLSLLREHQGSDIGNDPREIYTVFRNIQDMKGKSDPDGHLLVVSFKFAHLSYRANKYASLIPMLLIAGFPGFQQKVYAVNRLSGHWMGIYQWRSKDHMEDYKRSFVFRMMNKRALKSSIHIGTMNHTSIDAIFNEHNALTPPAMIYKQERVSDKLETLIHLAI